MSGLKRRLSRRRSAGPEGTEPPIAATPGPEDAPTPTPAEPEGRPSLLADPAAETNALPLPLAPERPGIAAPGEPYGATPPAQPAGEPVVPVADLPAGLDPDELAAVPASSARRGRVRRRVAFLRAARELLLRDLGGFVYELHRTAGDVEHEAHRRLRATKLERLTHIDAELHELELRLDDVRRNVVVREPGVGGECPQCGELFGSDAHYCAHCGLPLTESARRTLARAAQPEAPVAAEAPAPEPAVTDQPTVELPPPDGGSEFRWPHRAAETGGETTALGATPAPAAETPPAAGGEAVSGETKPGDPAAATADDAMSGDPAAAPADDAANGETERGAAGRSEPETGELFTRAERGT
jgi:hypothetical protein